MINRKLLQSLKLLYIVEKNIDHEYDFFPSEMICQHIHYANFENAWEEYKSFRPNFVIIHLLSDARSCNELTKLIYSVDPKCSILVISKDFLNSSPTQPVCPYVTKTIYYPIRFDQFEAIIVTLLRENPLVFSITNGLIYDPSNSVLQNITGTISLTPKENYLLNCLLLNNNRIVSYEEIESCVWHDDSMNRNTLTTIIRNLKNKIGNDNIIKNYSNQGYKIILDEK